MPMHTMGLLISVSNAILVRVLAFHPIAWPRYGEKLWREASQQ
jgi:hypothetical protein